MANEIKLRDDKPATFIPLGESASITLTPEMVRSIVAIPTKSGKQPDNRDICNFIMLCKSRLLNPFVGDAYLVGYDSQNGPTFSLITAVQALRKRAENSGQFDGMEYGCIVIDKDGNEQMRDGAYTVTGDKLVGGWAKCYRKDQKVPTVGRVKLATYSTGKSRWGVDPEGQICKVAEAAALRRAFPLENGGLYIAEEMERVQQPSAKAAATSTIKTAIQSTVISSAVEPEAEPDPQADIDAMIASLEESLARVEDANEINLLGDAFDFDLSQYTGSGDTKAAAKRGSAAIKSRLEAINAK